MRDQLDDLAFGDAADLIQVQAALTLNFFRILRGTKKGISDHDDGGTSRAAFGSEPHTGNFTEAERSRLLRLRSMHRITQHSDSGNTYFDIVFGDERTHARRRPSGNHIPRIEGHHAGNPADQKCAGINHQRSIARLPDRAIHSRLDKNIGWIEIGFNMRSNRAKSVEPFAACELHIALLDVASGDVVEARIPENERE